MATEQVLPFSVLSVVEDVLQQNGTQLGDTNSASRKLEPSCLRRYEAAGWLRKEYGVIGGKEFPAEPSEEEFRNGLRSGIILCNVLNRIQPGVVPKVVEGPCDSDDGAAALSAFQYFENVRNCLVALQEMGLPTFQASDLEQGGKSARLVDCVLAIKAYSEWKEGGKIGSWKHGGNIKPLVSRRPFLRKNSEQFLPTLTRTTSEKDGLTSDRSTSSDLGQDRNGSVHNLNALLREYLSDKKHEEIINVVESLLRKVTEEFERRLLIQHEMSKTNPEDRAAESETLNSILKIASEDEQMEEKEDVQPKQEECYDEEHCDNEESRLQVLNEQQNLVSQQHLEIHCSGEVSRIHVSKNQQKLLVQQHKEIQELKIIAHHTKSGMHSLQKACQQDLIFLSKHVHSLASAASGYRRVLEENRKLYNQLQDLKGNIRVYCRVRPFFGQANNAGSVGGIEEGSISMIIPSKYGKEGRKTFNFNRVFGPTATQAEVFADMQPLIRSVLDGYNVCIFAYGQTGSGKTHTMSGPNDLTEETVGVNYRALRDLFLLSQQRKDTIAYDIGVQMLEIYNDQVRDLLATDGGNKKLEIRNSSQNGINVPDATLVPVSSTSDVLSLMDLGHKNRAVSATAMNDRSSRSHSCLTVHVQGRDLTSGSHLRGSMHLVDLAGSERVDKSEVTGDRLKEAQHINKSLAALGDVISSLANKQAHVPYRNSRLTQLLQDSLGGQAKTLMFVHISPEPDALGETLSTLKFAERVSTVELGAARANKESSEVKELKEQIANLKAALARREGEEEPLQHSGNSSQDAPKLKSYKSSPTQSGGHRKPQDDSGSVESQKRATTKLKRRSLDLQDMIMHSPPWPPASSQRLNMKEEDKESVSRDWVDKIMVNRNDSLTSDDSLVGQWEAESKQSSPLLSPSSLSDTAKVYSEHSFKVTLNKKDSQDYDMATTDDSDDPLEVATSDSSESDLHWQPHVPKPTSKINGIVSKAKKPTHHKLVKNVETRSMIPSLIPAPSRKQLVSQPRKQASPIDGKRTGNAK
ncbi:kinesin-like protein KIN-14G isoform X2 [Prosopis cineraria]|uniref:kinesin-like protein KIN-14G isoform X2 n=1 Tax=Prosopis cineraria TaxID=364024 RepID=UPI00240F3E40|nr:kinesin-like protein KIN-14G isoform X2 [Prosopis cineraria]